jgi:hypothetical protein
LNSSRQREVLVRPGMSWRMLAVTILPSLAAMIFSEQVRSSRP